MAELTDPTGYSTCGCSAGQSDGEKIREVVRSRYAAAAESADMAQWTDCIAGPLKPV